MEILVFKEYFCACDTFLFNSGDINASTMLFGRNYLFVEAKTNVSIKERFPNVAYCINCSSAVGGFIHAGPWLNGQKHVRYARHCLRIRRVKVYLHNFEFQTIYEPKILVDLENTIPE